MVVGTRLLNVYATFAPPLTIVLMSWTSSSSWNPLLKACVPVTYDTEKRCDQRGTSLIGLMVPAVGALYVMPSVESVIAISVGFTLKMGSE